MATVYGVGFANLVLLPISAKLRGVARRQADRRDLIIEGVLSIQEGQNPRLIEQKLRGLMAPMLPTEQQGDARFPRAARGIQSVG